MSDIYKSSGVDTEAGELAVSLMKDYINQTKRNEVVGDFGGFAGLFDVSFLKNYDKPLLATSTDGVGTKIKIAQLMDKHDTIGIDLVAMVMDDIVVCGAQPLFMTDYIAVGKLKPQQIAEIVKGIATGCKKVGASLVGGETAEHPNLMNENDYDIAGAGVGVVEERNLLGPNKVKEGDVIIGLLSSGMHSNGYSLVRKIVFTDNKINIDKHFDEFNKTIGEELLTPTSLYAKSCLNLQKELGNQLHAFSHITGGGISANVSRVLPSNLHANLNRNNWQVPLIMQVLKDLAKTELINFETTFNMGLGMVAIVEKESVEKALTSLKVSNIESVVVGEIIKRTEQTKSDSPAKGGKGGSASLLGKYS